MLSLDRWSLRDNWKYSVLHPRSSRFQIIDKDWSNQKRYITSLSSRLFHGMLSLMIIPRFLKVYIYTKLYSNVSSVLLSESEQWRPLLYYMPRLQFWHFSKPWQVHNRKWVSESMKQVEWSLAFVHKLLTQNVPISANLLSLKIIKL